MSSPADWKNYEDFAAGIDTNRLPPTDALIGETFALSFWRDRLTLEFVGRDQLRWTAGGRSATDRYEAILVAPATYFIDVTFTSRPRESLTVIANTLTCRVLAVKSVALEEPVAGQPRVNQTFDVGILGTTTVPGSGLVPHPTRDLIGLRAFYRYSPNHLYEHIYLSSQRYAWQCLVGEQRGHGDVDLATTYKFAADEYVFAFREFKIPVASVFFLNFRERRSTGKFLGLTRAGTVQNRKAGALIQRASMTFYDPGAEPP